jgi:phage terminase small subunit
MPGKTKAKTATSKKISKKAPVKAPPAKKKDLGATPDGAVLDLSTLGVDDLKLTPKEKLFIYWYCKPGTDSFQVQTRAAIKAGYKSNTAYAAGYNLRKKPEIASAIKRVMETYVGIDVEEEFQNMLALQKKRIHYDIGDYYKEVVINADKEQPEVIEVIKNLHELTPEQRMAIESVDFKGKDADRKVYMMADREKSISFIMNLRKQLNSQIADDGDGEEETMEIIMERLSIKKTVRRNKDEISKIARLVDMPKGEPIQEL